MIRQKTINCEDFLREILEFCLKYNMQPELFFKACRHKKVIPMIRGFHQEYHLQQILERIITLEEKTGVEDFDLCIQKNKNKIESKQTKANSIKHKKEGTYCIVKNHRSRTLGAEKAAQRAIELRISKELLLKHPDSYRGSDYFGIITTLENAFCENQLPISLSDEDYCFLENIGVKSIADLANIPFWCKASNLVSTKENKTCRKRGCDGGCGFIPNYPIIFFPKGESCPQLPWRRIFAQS